MNLRQMQYFVAIAEDGSISRSAERLLVAQPSLSAQIKSLEAELGGPVFERIPRGVRLTAAGKAFLPEARAAITHAANATRNARSVLGLKGGELEVATITSVAFGILPSAFQIWHQHYPAATIALREYTDRNALAEAVRMGVADVAVGPQPAQWRGPIIELGWEQFVVIVPSTDPLAGTTDPVPLSALERPRLGAVRTRSRAVGPHSRGLRGCRIRSTSDGADNSSCCGEPPGSRRTRSNTHTRECGAHRPARRDPAREASLDPKIVRLHKIRMAATGYHFRRSASTPALAHETGRRNCYPLARTLARGATTLV